MHISFATDDLMPFPVYRTPQFDSRIDFESTRPELAQSLEHFYQSERYRGTNEPLRLAILDANSAKEARKLANRKTASERPGWEGLQERVMETGLWMKFREHPHYARHLLLQPQDAVGCYPYRDHFWGSDREGISKARYESVLLRIRSKILARNIMRVAITGSSNLSNHFLLSSKLSILFRRLPPDLILVGCRKGTDDLVERWAIEHALPVLHVPYRGRRNSNERERHMQALLRLATHVVVFSDGETESNRIARLAKQLGRATRTLPISQRTKPPSVTAFPSGILPPQFSMATTRK